MAVTFVADVRSHTLVTLRAVALAWVMKVVFFVLFIYWSPWLRAALAMLPEHGPYVASTYRIVDGINVRHAYQFPWAFAVYEPLAILFVSAFVAWATGWLVARLHRHNSTSSLLAIAITFIAIDASPVWTLRHPLGEEVIFDALWLNILHPASMVLAIAFLFVGGLGRTRRYFGFSASALDV